MQSIYFSIHQTILHHFTIYKIQRTAMFISLHKQSNTVDEIFLFRLEHLIQGVPRNMIVGEYFKISSSIIFLCCWIPKTINNILYGSHVIVKLI